MKLIAGVTSRVTGRHIALTIDGRERMLNPEDALRIAEQLVSQAKSILDKDGRS